MGRSVERGTNREEMEIFVPVRQNTPVSPPLCSREREPTGKMRNFGGPSDCHVAATSQLVNEENWLRIHEWAGVNKVAAC